MPNISVTVRPQPGHSVTVSSQVIPVTVQGQTVMVDLSDPSLTVSMIEGFMAIVRLGDLLDVDISGLEDGCVLVYDFDELKWKVTRTLEKQYISPGQF